MLKAKVAMIMLAILISSGQPLVQADDDILTNGGTGGGGLTFGGGAWTLSRSADDKPSGPPPSAPVPGDAMAEGDSPLSK